MRLTFEDLALNLEDLPDEPSPAQFRMLRRTELEKMEFTRFKWVCQGKGCSNGTHVRDYGVEGWYFLDRNSTSSFKQPNKYWYKVQERFWLCGKHNKMFDRLKKSGFSEEHISRRILDWGKDKLLPLE